MSDAPVSASLAERIERGDVFAPTCPSRAVMKHITSSWGALSLIALQSGPLRFSVLRRRVSGVSERMLAHTLKLLEHDGLVDRRSFPVVPPHVEYALTPLGADAAVKVAALADWIESRIGAILESRAAKEDVTPSAWSRAAAP